MKWIAMKNKTVIILLVIGSFFSSLKINSQQEIGLLEVNFTEVDYICRSYYIIYNDSIYPYVIRYKGGNSGIVEKLYNQDNKVYDKNKKFNNDFFSKIYDTLSKEFITKSDFLFDRDNKIMYRYFSIQVEKIFKMNSNDIRFINKELLVKNPNYNNKSIYFPLGMKSIKLSKINCKLKKSLLKESEINEDVIDNYVPIACGIR